MPVVSVQKVPSIYLEEECWLNMQERGVTVKPYCLTGTLTNFIQKGRVWVPGAGLPSCVLEAFAQSLLRQGMRKQFKYTSRPLNKSVLQKGP
ncbi:PRELI domain-containing protein 2 [Pogoniulus pusillus]|uniref:PRELI domain-containing protein 2 n=1 Tax=Pogoniulus pusillus TaxID=488313 RepID=UPI0030B93F5D